MDPLKFTTVAHRQHRFCSPIDPANFNALCARVCLASGERVIDLGCGKGEALLRLAGEFQVGGLGVDVNPAFLAEAREQSAARGLAEKVEIRCVSATEVAAPAKSFALGLCIGSTHACGGYRETLAALAIFIRPGGHLLIGELFWNCEPAREYLDFLGAAREDFDSHPGNLATATRLGLEICQSVVSTESDWDGYEALYAESVENYVVEHPTDPDSGAMGSRIREWKEMYRRHGRATFGFALYLLRKPAGSQADLSRV